MGLDAIRYSGFYAIVLTPVVWFGRPLWDRERRKMHSKWLLGVWLFVSACISYFAWLLSMDRLFMRTCELEQVES